MSKDTCLQVLFLFIYVNVSFYQNHILLKTVVGKSCM